MNQDLGRLTPTDGRRPQTGDEVLYSNGMPFGVVAEVQPAMFKVRAGTAAHWMSLKAVQSRRVGNVRLSCDISNVRDFTLGLPAASRR
jgi:hypothetical protein